MLEARRLTKTFGEHIAIDNVSLDVASGEVVGLLGRNGAGKTTTLSCIAGLLRPDRGSVAIEGADGVEKGWKARKQLGFAPQDIALYPGLTTRQNLDFFARIGGLQPRQAKDAVDEIAARLGLKDLLGRQVLSLSGGQRRFVHVASALIHRPRLVMLDEPSAGLDVEARVVLFDYLRGLAGEGAGILVSSHYVAEVERYCERAVLIHKGQILADAPIQELIRDRGESHVDILFDSETRRVAGDDAIGALAALDVRCRGKVQSVQVSRPSLEQVFLDLIGVTTNDELELDDV